MSSTTLPVSAPARRRPVFRIFVYGLLFLLIILAIVTAWAHHVVSASLPQLDGTLSVPGLTSKVTVTRDAHGIPTIEAASLDDLFFAQGYVTAQDRLWQMDVMRRFAGGEIAELLGPKFVEHDREQRILGLRAAAQHAAAAVPRRDRVYFEAYARGVNAFISSHPDRLPVEFRILKYSPKPWTLEDSILMGARMVQDLNHYPYGRALDREKILAKIGPELTADLYVNTSWRDRPPSGVSRRIDAPKKNNDDEDTDEEDSGSSVARALPSGSTPYSPADSQQDPILVPGSNNWVVSGDHTVTGKPLLSNDMHLTHQMPNLWYEAHLHCGNYDVVGVTLPGTPFVIVGHNRRIAWGFTNVGPTVEDVYIEEFNDQGQYKGPQTTTPTDCYTEWYDPQHRTEVIHVKGAPDVIVDVVVTRHGPIITDLIPGETRKLALHWTLYDGLVDPFFDVNSAGNWNEFRNALSTWDAPSQNTVYADVDGHIGYQATGHIPIRAGDGALPVSGADNAHEWTGYIPFDQLPRVYDPPSGIIATANGRITPDGYAHSIATEWGSPWRTDRLYRVLDSGKKFAPADMLALETDIYSAFDRFCAERFVYALDHSPKLSARATRAREIMRDWDGRLTIESAAPTIEILARNKLMELLLEPKLGGAANPAKNHDDSEEGSVSWKDYRWFMSSIWLENVLTKQPKRWLPDKYESYDAVLTAAVEAAITDSEAPKDLAKWNWGNHSPIDIDHPVLSQIPFIGRWTGPGLHPQSGGGYTVKQVGRRFGPSERFTANLADLDASTLNTVTGQAGNPLSPYYMDQWQAWYQGFTFPLPFTSAAVEKAKTHQLVLQP
jgi:penicillin amidase